MSPFALCGRSSSSFLCECPQALLNVFKTAIAALSPWATKEMFGSHFDIRRCPTAPYTATARTQVLMLKMDMKVRDGVGLVVVQNQTCYSAACLLQSSFNVLTNSSCIASSDSHNCKRYHRSACEHISDGRVGAWHLFSEHAPSSQSQISELHICPRNRDNRRQEMQLTILTLLQNISSETVIGAVL